MASPGATAPAPTPWTPDQALRTVQRSTGPAGPTLPRGVGVARNPGGSRGTTSLPLARIATAGPDMPHATATTSSPAGDPVVQRVAAPGPAGMTLTAVPVVQRETPADTSQPPPSGGGAPGRSDRELDELAESLFGRFRTQLRRELIHEREAKGLSFDAF